VTTAGFQHFFEPAADPAAPPLLLLHGTGGDEHDLLSLGRALSPGSALLSPLGNVSENGSRRFFARLAEGVFDPAEITARAGELALWIACAAEHYGLGAARLTAVGFSNGANIASALLLLHPTALARAVLFRPMVVLDRPAAPGSLAGKRVLLAAGSADPIVPPDHPPRFAALLRAGGANITVHTGRAGHGLISSDRAAARDWLLAPPAH
jgi:predicted esterase